MTTQQELISAVKRKKELSGIGNAFIAELLEQYIKKNNISLNSLNKKDMQIVVKDIRSQLRIYSGRFQKIRKLSHISGQESIQNLLKTQSSTAERVDFYPTLKQLLKKLNVSSILDIGCGLNPIAFASPEITYYAIDINEHAIRTVQAFFQKHHIKGRAVVANLKTFSIFPPADICLLFKVLDLLDTKVHKNAELLLKKIPCSYILTSFSTKTLSGKPMRHPQRGWIERLCQRLGFTFTLLASKNELFYLIHKPSSNPKLI